MNNIEAVKCPAHGEMQKSYSTVRGAIKIQYYKCESCGRKRTVHESIGVDDVQI